MQLVTNEQMKTRTNILILFLTTRIFNKPILNQMNTLIRSIKTKALSRKNIIIPNISWYLNQNIDVIAKDVAKAITKVEEETDSLHIVSETSEISKSEF
jgi:hypothetical protein